NNSCVTRPLPSLRPGSDGTPSTVFHRYYAAAKTTVVAHPALRFFSVAPGALELTSLVRSPGPGSPLPKRLGVDHRFHPLRSLVPRRPTVFPGSQRTPLRLCPDSQIPAGLLSSSFGCASSAPGLFLAR